jgi:hypothetical protein
MASPIQLARTYARSYEASSRTDKGTILDTLTEATGWTRDHARHQLRSQFNQIRAGVSLDAVVDRRRLKPKKFSPRAQLALELVWKSFGRPCGKYLEAGMSDCLDSLERHGHLCEGRHGYSSSVRRELLDISAATIDRYLRGAKAGDHDDSWLTGTGAGMRASFPRQRMRSLLEPDPAIPRRAADDHDTDRRGLCHSGRRDRVGVTKTFAPGTQVVDMLAQMVRGVPFVVTGVLLPPAVPDSAITTWAEANLIEIHCTSDLRQGPRVPDRTFSGLDLPLGTPHATDAAIIRVNGLWSALADRLNYFMPVKNPVGWRLTPSGVRRREYDKPRTPVSRLIASGILCPEQTRELHEKSRGLDIAGLTARIAELKSTLH